MNRYNPDAADCRFLAGLYDQYRNLLMGFAYRFLKDYDLAQDMVQDAVLRLFGHIDTLRLMEEPAKIAYLKLTVRTVCILYLRKRAKDQKAVDKLVEAVEDCPDPVHIAEKYETAKETDAALLKLPPKDRELLIYRYFLEYSVKEIGKLMNMKPTAVRMALSRARARVLMLLDGGESP